MAQAADTIDPPRAPRHHTEDWFAQGMKWSLIGHLGIVVAVLIKSLVFPSKPMLYIPTLRVDLVGLPDILKKDLSQVPKTASDKEISEALKKAETDAQNMKPPPPAPKKPDVEPAKPDEMVLKPKVAPQETEAQRKKKLSSALARIKSLAKLSQEDQGAPVIRGNQVSKGTSLSGDAKESAVANYFDSLRGRLQENWALPVWISRQNLSAQVQVFIDARGRLHGFRFVRLSGNAQFDDAVKRTLNESQPYPVPPSDLASALLTDGVLVGFPL